MLIQESKYKANSIKTAPEGLDSKGQNLRTHLGHESGWQFNPIPIGKILVQPDPIGDGKEAGFGNPSLYSSQRDTTS
ncbi:unnamed protein product [Dovyalis caffra]|uniref:Uncharacterized protein n=1 Tax=Dovyalis caffra TaxID=77055 RepID=A0AAV1R6D5_9ROSI|nr:unnamed protein product [Dovyalis caffra]